MDCGFDIVSSQDEKYDFVIKIASGKTDFNEIYIWIEKHIINSNLR